MSFKLKEIREILGDAFTDEIGSKLISLHRTVVDPIMEELDESKREASKFKTEAEKVPGLRQKVKELEDGEDWKGKYEREKEAHDAYKTQVAREAEMEKVKTAYRKLLVEERISAKTIESVMNATDYSKMKLKEDGTLDGIDDLKKDIAERWGGFQVSTRQRGESVDNPPRSNNGRMTRDEIMKIKDASERQKAISENLDLFQKG